jgi:NTP pyrophosphatase (non-canonical NTP hydrolase)
MSEQEWLLQDARRTMDEATWWIATPECGETSRGHIEKLVYALRNALAREEKLWPKLTGREVILLHVSDERDRQDAKWGGIPGVERRDDHTYAAVLTEEVGEACQAWLQRDTRSLREELVQTAAVAVAWIEELDNGGAVPRPESGVSVDWSMMSDVGTGTQLRGRS